MPKILKRGPAEDDLGTVTVIDRNEATNTLTRWKFDVTDKSRERIRRYRTQRVYERGGDREEIDNGGVCAGETLKLRNAMKIIHGRRASAAPDTVPRNIAEALRDEGATEVLA
jgi:hypothetical protein